jgi:hypothetical protein
VHVVAHLALPSAAHWLPGHALTAGVLHAPTVSQTDAVVTLPAVQDAGVHTVALSG